MDASRRRTEISEILENSQVPISASALAAKFSVSRQVIVGDVALMRAAGAQISATPRGYVINSRKEGLVRTVACIHSAEDMETELNVMVDNGCIVYNVIVEHPVYGEITGELSLSSRYDVNQFIQKTEDNKAVPLSYLTGGVHLHTLLCPDEAAFWRVTEKLRELGILFTENGD